MKDLKRYLIMAKPYWGLLVLTVAALIGVSAVSLVTPEMVRRLTAMLTEGTATKERVITYAVILLAAYVAKVFLTFISKFTKRLGNLSEI